MDPTIPGAAARLLDFIGGIEAPKGYGTVYGNHQAQLAKPLTAMTVDEVVAAGSGWTKRFGSSACGRYQFMKDTLIGLRKEDPAIAGQRFDGDLQDRLGLVLLRRRGYDQFMAGRLGIPAFGLRLAQEWASFPVLTAVKGAHRRVARGETYYAGDRLNKSLVAPERIEGVLAEMQAMGGAGRVAGSPKTAPAPAPQPAPGSIVIMSAAPAAKPNRLSAFLNRMLGRADAAAPTATPLPAEKTRGDPAVFRVQRALADRGYAEVGELDGVIGGPGSKTRSAIRAAQADNGLQVTGEMDAAFLAALPGMPARTLPPERTEATVRDLRAAGSTPVKAADGMGMLGRILLGGGALGGIDASGALNSIKETADQTTATVQSVQSVVNTSIGAVQWVAAHWYLLAIPVGAWAALAATRQLLEIRALYRAGTITRAGA